MSGPHKICYNLTKMKLQKRLFVLSSHILTIAYLAVSVLSFMVVIVPATKLSAQECFNQSGSASGIQYTAEECPSNIGAEAGKCYSRPVSSSGVGNFSEIDCDVTGRSSGNGDDVLKNDCSGDNIRAGEERISEDDPGNHCGILDYLVTFINVLSGLAGVVIVASIVMGGIQYSSAGSDASKVSAAKGRIRNAIIALLLFLFGYGILNYLVPGGVL